MSQIPRVLNGVQWKNLVGGCVGGCSFFKFSPQVRGQTKFIDASAIILDGMM